MALPTGILTNKVPYQNADLNTIFAPFYGSVDFGTFLFTIDNVAYTTWQTGAAPHNLIREGIWSSFNGINSVSLNSGNITLLGSAGSATDNMGFNIKTAGMYKLNIMLFFAGLYNETSQDVVFFLQNTPTTPPSNNFTSSTMIPSPNMGQIYSINTIGATGDGNSLGNANNPNYSNFLAVGSIDASATNITSRPYFFRFLASSTAASGGSVRNNMQSIEIVFEATSDQKIYPFISVVQNTSTDPSTTLDGVNSKWMFTKIA